MVSIVSLHVEKKEHTKIVIGATLQMDGIFAILNIKVSFEILHNFYTVKSGITEQKDGVSSYSILTPYPTPENSISKCMF